LKLSEVEKNGKHKSTGKFKKRKGFCR